MATSDTGQQTNVAAWLDAAGSPFSIREAPMPTPGPDEVVMEPFALAVNPVDAFRQSLGMMISTYPWILGVDGAGVITAVGDQVRANDFKVGDRVIAVADEWFINKSSNAMWQKYVALGTKLMAKLPDNVSFTDGVVLPLGTSTAAGMLFERETMNLSWPVNATAGISAPSARSKNGVEKEVVIVWGGSSSVGACAIQLAKAAGYRVVATARKANHGLVSECGADAAFDYTDSNAVTELCEWVRKEGLKLAGVAAAVSTDDAGMKACGSIAQQLEGRKFVSTSLARGISPVPEMPDGVEASNCKTSSSSPLRRTSCANHHYRRFGNHRGRFMLVLIQGIPASSSEDWTDQV